MIPFANQYSVIDVIQVLAPPGSGTFNPCSQCPRVAQRVWEERSVEKEEENSTEEWNELGTGDKNRREILNKMRNEDA